jgi:CBS domain-containing protein
MSLLPDRQTTAFDVLSANPETTVANARRFLRGHGWARTHVIERSQKPSLKVPGYFDLHLVVEAVGVRAAVTSEGAARHGPRHPDEWYEVRSIDEVQRIFATTFDPRSFKVGTRVRTKAEGESFAGGRRHVMPAGVIGVVAGRDRISVRVRSDSPRKPSSAITFAYAPGDLERVSEPGATV